MSRNVYCTRCGHWVDTDHSCVLSDLSKPVENGPGWIAMLVMRLAWSLLMLRAWLWRRQWRRQWRAMQWGFMRDVSPWASFSFDWRLPLWSVDQAARVYDFTWLAAAYPDEVRAWDCAARCVAARAEGDHHTARYWERRLGGYASHCVAMQMRGAR